MNKRKKSANENRRKDGFLSRIYLCRYRQRSYRSKSNKGATLIIGCVLRAGASTRLFSVLCKNLERMGETAQNAGRVYLGVEREERMDSP